MTRPEPVPAATSGTDDEPVFAQPWHAQAFALAVALHERGWFAWPQFAAELGTTIRSDPDRDYYRNWLTALERVALDRGLTTAEDLEQRERAWHRAARATPHGRPIVLGAARTEPPDAASDRASS